MTVDVRSVHFELSQVNRDFLDRKLERLAYAKDLVVDLLFALTHEKDFKCECTVNFRWGAQAHLVEHDFELTAGIDKLIDRLEQKIAKEKDKVQDRKA
ncbi:MAG: HPF/RaiA family ribosome-associated protein [Spirochaetales bacterium]|nr:HPF/RaiA family ribosome-associated protein [Spirochaetales bacterium]